LLSFWGFLKSRRKKRKKRFNAHCSLAVEAATEAAAATRLLRAAAAAASSLLRPAAAAEAAAVAAAVDLPGERLLGALAALAVATRAGERGGGVFLAEEPPEPREPEEARRLPPSIGC
jgi:hypothetical protein